LVARRALCYRRRVRGVVGVVVVGIAVSALAAGSGERFRAVLQEPVPILRLPALPPGDAATAEQLAVADPRVQAALRDAGTGGPHRSEVFAVVPVRETDVVPAIAPCRDDTCLRVETYDYAANATVAATVDVTKNAVLRVELLRGAQPEVPPHLAALAAKIAAGAPEVRDALGRSPDAGEPLMASTKTSLNRTKCERSEHLCVAPTFVEGPRALWAIVDLTDEKLVGVRWTEVGVVPGERPTEISVQNERITRRFCQQTTPVERDGWSFAFALTASDGLEIRDVQFRGKPILRSAKVVDWHVSYSQTDGFGYSDAMGCPDFSTSAVLAYEDPRFEDLKGDAKGFVLSQFFQSAGWPSPCNYSYGQRFEFHADGRLRVAVASMGRGCGQGGVYRPVLRLAFAGDAVLKAFDGKGWSVWREERYEHVAADAPAQDGRRYRIALDAAGTRGVYLEPGRAQFGDGGRGDTPWVYATRAKPDGGEGEGDLLTIGPCCNDDHRQGPERFMAPPESLEGGGLVVWYVPEMRNDGRPGQEYCWADRTLEEGLYVPRAFPCWAGPMLVPFEDSAG